jgi:hypothetical protein
MMYQTDMQYKQPGSVAEAADLLYSDLTAADIAVLEQLDDEQFDGFYSQVAASIIDEFKIWQGNNALLRSCLEQTDIDAANLDPAMAILEAVRERIRQRKGVVIVVR